MMTQISAVDGGSSSRKLDVATAMRELIRTSRKIRRILIRHGLVVEAVGPG